MHKRPSEQFLNRVLASVSLLHFCATVVAWITGATDWLSGPLLVTASILCAVVGHFSKPYLHRDPGYSRFFLFYLVFMGGISLLFSSTDIESILVGWELVGISSVLLIGFFSQREQPAHHSVYALVTYRICDIALIAAVMSWETAPPVVLGGLLIFASLAKSAQLPFSGWLPLAMEGPTPSSAIFYGALSLHAGAYLLLRFSHYWMDTGLAPIIIVIGAGTSLYATVTGRTRSDAKGLLAYAGMAQVGIIFIEIGLGYPQLALWHIVGHCFVRTLQLLRAPSLMQDFHQMGYGQAWPRRMTPVVVKRGYRFFLSGFHLNDFVRNWVSGPVLSLARWLDAGEEAWTHKISHPVTDLEDKQWHPTQES